MRRRLASVAVVLVAALVGLVLSGALSSSPSGGGGSAGTTGAGGGPSAAALPSPPVAESEHVSLSDAAADPGRGVAIVALGRSSSVPVYASAGAAKPERSITRRTVEGKPLQVVFLALERRPGWVKVQLPVRPDGGTAWVHANAVELHSNPFRVVVDLRSHKLIAYENNREITRTPIGVGRAVSPTPTGRYFITDLLKPPNPNGFYGPYAFGLSAYSHVYSTFGAGDGQVGIHGTSQPAAIGTDVSHGCIRVHDAVIVKLAKQLPLGTPVQITRA